MKELLKKVEKIVAKGEIAHFEQFLLLPQSSQVSLLYYNQWERVKTIQRTR